MLYLQGRVPFVVPDHVDWNMLADQLSMKFMSQTGKGLSETNLAYIRSKLFGMYIMIQIKQAQCQDATATAASK